MPQPGQGLSDDLLQVALNLADSALNIGDFDVGNLPAYSL